MPVLVPALLTMIAAQLLDLGTFIEMVRRVGIAGEANPFVLDLFRDGGLPTLILAKVSLVVLIGSVSVALLAMRGRTWQRAGGVLLAVAIFAGIVGGWSNALTISAA
jgi:hypothetical protein